MNEELRTLYPTPNVDPNNWSVRRIDAIARAFPEMVSYLEVGVHRGLTFDMVSLPLRTGVDPEPLFRLDRLPHGVDFFQGTSDDFFDQFDPRENFDIIFLDGLHTFQQTYRDLINALRLCPRGIVLIDDVIPSDEVSAIPDHEFSLAERHRRHLPGEPWHGDVFRMMLCLADHHPELDWVTITAPDNPQTFVWKRHPDTRSLAVTSAHLESYGRFSYADVFGSGVPGLFHPTTEDDGVAQAIAGLRSLRCRTRSLPTRVMARLRRDCRYLWWKYRRRRSRHQQD